MHYSSKVQKLMIFDILQWNNELTKILSFLFIVFTFSVDCYCGSGSKFEIKSFVSCKRGDLLVDHSKKVDQCSSAGKKSAPVCQQMSRVDLTGIVKSKFSTYDSFQIKNMVEFLHLKTFRMSKKHTQGRDYCFITVPFSQLARFGK